MSNITTHIEVALTKSLFIDALLSIRGTWPTTFGHLVNITKDHILLNGTTNSGMAKMRHRDSLNAVTDLVHQWSLAEKLVDKLLCERASRLRGLEPKP